MIEVFHHLERFPRVRLVSGPTPLESLPNLASDLGSRMLFVKRDDCTGLAMGGNKVRQLEFYFGEARSQGADTVVITGAVQSNYVRIAAAAACRLGMGCHIQLENRVPRSDSTYVESGNVLLDRLFGATITSYPDGEDEAGADRSINEIANRLESEGKRPYVIPLGPGHPPLGALGYVDAARELVHQMQRDQLEIDEIVVPSGSGATHAGLLLGLRALGSTVPVTGSCVRRNASDQHVRIRDRCREIAVLLEVDPFVPDDDIHLTDAFLAPGYGQLNPPTVDAIRKLARREGLLLDPVYSGKTAAAFIARARSVGPDRSLLFVHTGGTPALFAYAQDLSPPSA